MLYTRSSNVAFPDFTILCVSCCNCILRSMFLGGDKLEKKRRYYGSLVTNYCTINPPFYKTETRRMNGDQDTHTFTTRSLVNRIVTSSPTFSLPTLFIDNMVLTPAGLTHRILGSETCRFVIDQQSYCSTYL